METNEIITNEEVIDKTTEIANAGSNKAFTIAACAGLTILGGIAAYKYIVKPLAAKIRAKKEKQEIDEICDTVDGERDDQQST